MDNIAVIGIANLFPGSKTPDKFWQSLVDKKDTRSKATLAQIGSEPEGFYGKKGDTDKYYCMSGGYIRNFTFDSKGYDLPADYLAGLDQIFQWPLYVAREALRDGGYLDDQQLLEHCGIILGNLSFPTKKSNHMFLPLYHKTVESGLQQLLGSDQYQLSNFSQTEQPHPANGLIAGYPSSLVAQSLGLGGCSFSLDAACASSCYSVKLACDYINTGKSKIMLAGAVSAADPFFVNMGFSIFQAYPTNNHSAPLDKNSGGLFAGEGAGMMLLKRYDEALTDGDHIYAVIKGGGLSNDGKGEFVLSPNTKGQVLVFERAYKDAKVSPTDVEFVECHATGTPKGDKVELGSMETFFGRYDAKPLIGSVKSNVSHLLTAAGMPGMIKTIMAMNEGLIPPTINVEEPNSSPSAYITGAQIPTEACKWPDTAAGKPRHAGVSVFGFGGSNAHLVFEQYIAGDSVSTAVSHPVGANEQLAIVGMDAHFGACEGLENFKDSVINGKQHFTVLPQNRWKGIDKESDLLRTMGMEAEAAPLGAYIDEFEMDFLRFKVPPNPNDCLIAQQLLMMKVADNAAKQAQLKESSHVAVLVAMGIELEIHQFRGRVNLPVQIAESLQQSGIQLSAEQRQQLEEIAKDSVHNAAKLNQYTSFIGNIMASRISSLWNFSGPAITVSAEENSAYRCLEIADNLFQTSDVEAVIVAGVDLAGSAESVVWRNQFARLNSGNATLSFDKNVNGWMVGEGAGAVVLKRLKDAKQNKNQIFAAIDAIDFVAGVSAVSVKKAANNALRKAACKAQDVNYVEVFGSGLKNQDDAEMAGLGEVYRDVAVGCVKANIGHTYSASGIASLIKTALCLHAAVLPATPQWQEPKAACTFAVPTQAQSWTGSAANGKRLAAINGLGFDGFSAHVLLSSVAGFEQAMPVPAVQGKVRPQLMKTIKLGGPHIKSHILQEEHKAAFSSVASQHATGVVKKIQNPVCDYSNSEVMDIPLPACQVLTPENPQLQTNQKVNAMTAENKFQQPALDESSLSEDLKSSAQLAKYKENMSNIGQAHNAFLDSRQQSSQKIAELIQLQAEVAGGVVPAGAAATQAIQPKAIQLVERYNKPDKIIWDTGALVEFAEGDIAKVFGEEFAIIDSYSRRTRLPTTDYLLVSRVTELEAETGKFEPCMMTTEYDVPTDAPYLVDGQVPWAVSVESGQCDLLLISYLGIDFQCKGDRVYRLLDCTLTFLEDMPFGGETLRYEIHIDSFARNGDTLLFFFHYDCFVGDKKVLIMRGGCAGFFTDKELDEGKGVVETDADKAERANAIKQSFNPLISNNRLQYEIADMRKLVSGDIEGCFGPQYATGGTNTSLKFASEKFLMIERVSKIDPTAGSWGLGVLEAHKQLEPEHWYFPCHFKDDQVMAGSLMAEGCGQLVMFYMMFLGMQTGVKNARFQPMPGESQKVRCRGQVLPQSNVLTYRMEITAIGMVPQPFIKANVDIILDGKVVVDFKNIGVMMKEETSTPGTALTVSTTSIVKKDPFANVNAPLMKVESDDSKPLNKGVTPIKHFAAPIIPGGNREPDVVPYEPYHLFEFATGDIDKCFGSEFDFYKAITPPRTPCGDLQLTTRVTEVRGKRGEVKKPAYCKGEYEVPEDAWYFTGNTYENQIPYSILMEISLQPNGFVSAWVGTTLELPGEELFFRNLDGEGELLRHVDLRGKTIINDSNLLSTTILGKNIIQSFDFTLSTDGEPFYKGTAVFGYFLADALKDQLGLDNGKVTQPWHINNNTPANQVERIDLRDENMSMYQAPATKPHYRLAGAQLHFIDTVDIIEGGGKADIAYVYSEREIDPTDWFFRYHFHGDPVMPGSLGVEAIIESMQVYALKNDLGAQFKNPRFAQILSNIKWKYRGQINPLNKQMSLDVHITKVIKDNDRVTIIGDANLSKDGLRIYEVFDIAICLEEAE